MKLNFFGIVQNKQTGKTQTYQAPLLENQEPVEFLIQLDNWGYRVTESRFYEGSYQKVYGVAEVLQ